MGQNISINLSSKNATTKIQPSHKSPVCFPVVLGDQSSFWRHFSNFPNKLRSSQESREKSFVCSLSVTCVLQFGVKKKKKKQRFRSVSGPHVIYFQSSAFLLVTMKIYQNHIHIPFCPKSLLSSIQLYSRHVKVQMSFFPFEYHV